MTKIYTPRELLSRVRQLEPHLPISGRIAPPRAYPHHKAHWEGWLREYDGPGFYGRKNSDRDAAYIYSHVQNVGMVIWLAEAANVESTRVLQASMRAVAVGGRVAAQCGAARKLLPWPMVAKGLFPR